MVLGCKICCLEFSVGGVQKWGALPLRDGSQMISLQQAALWPVCEKMMPSVIPALSCDPYWLRYVAGCHRITVNTPPQSWSQFVRVGLKPCSHVSGFGPGSLSHMTAGDDLIYLGEGMETLGLLHALFDGHAGTVAKLGLLFCGSLLKPAVCHAQPTCARGQGWEHMAPCRRQPAPIKAGAVPAGRGTQYMGEGKAASASWVPACWLT